MRDEATGDFRLAQLHAHAGTRSARGRRSPTCPASIAEALCRATPNRSSIPHEVAAQVPTEYLVPPGIRRGAGLPAALGARQMGAMVAVGTPGAEPFDDAALRLARGVADITSLALGNARRHQRARAVPELVESLDAIFWEADADDLELTFIGGRLECCSPTDAGLAMRAPGATTSLDGIALAVAEVRRAIAEGVDDSVEYRVRRRPATPLWVRDLVHVVPAAGPRQMRGLIVDITERKQAEQTLRESERKYSEAFLREREAAQQLRALDDMKNTFLEAVSHDLRTPLTSILGSALTLEQSGSSCRRTTRSTWCNGSPPTPASSSGCSGRPARPGSPAARDRDPAASSTEWPS